jgi:hypothetical protein
MTWKRSIFGKNVTWHIHMRHMTDLSETWLTKRMYVGRHVEIGDAAALYVEQQCDMTHSYAAYDSFIWDMTHQKNVEIDDMEALYLNPKTWHGKFECGMWLIHLRDNSPKRTYVGRHVEIDDMEALYFEQQYDMTRSHVTWLTHIWHDSHESHVMPLMHMVHVNHMWRHSCLRWMSHMPHMNVSCHIVAQNRAITCDAMCLTWIMCVKSHQTHVTALIHTRHHSHYMSRDTPHIFQSRSENHSEHWVVFFQKTKTFVGYRFFRILSFR